jgi:hypothetical protein
MTEFLLISDMRNNHKDVPNKVDESIKYTDGARLGIHSCEIAIVDGSLNISGGELQYGTKRYTIDSYSGNIPYCYSDTLGTTVYSTFDSIPVEWDDPDRAFPDVGPASIPEGYSANLWVYAVLGCSREVDGQAGIICVLGNTLYLTEREAMSEYEPLTEVTPYNGTVTSYNTAGNLVCIGRVTTNVVTVGDGPICTFSFSQPLAFPFNVPPVPSIRDIPDSYKYVEGYAYTVTNVDRNRDIAVYHTDSEEGDHNTTIELPDPATFGAGYWVRILSLSTYVGPLGGAYDYLRVGKVSEGWAPQIIWNGSPLGTQSIVTMQYYASVRLISNGTYWIAIDLSGTWTSGASYRYDGNIQDGVEDNVVTIDEYGNVQDSGIAIGDLGGGGGGSPTISIKTTTYPIVEGDANNTVFIMNASTDEEFTLETSPADNRHLIFKNIGAGTCTVNATSGVDIDGDQTVLLGTYETITIICEAGPPIHWHII